MRINEGTWTWLPALRSAYCCCIHDRMRLDKTQGNHVLLREFEFVNATPRNRLAFVRLVVESWRNTNPGVDRNRARTHAHAHTIARAPSHPAASLCIDGCSTSFLVCSPLVMANMPHASRVLKAESKTDMLSDPAVWVLWFRV
jgi:hypothetical protein